MATTERSFVQKFSKDVIISSQPAEDFLQLQEARARQKRRQDCFQSPRLSPGTEYYFADPRSPQVAVPLLLFYDLQRPPNCILPE